MGKQVIEILLKLYCDSDWAVRRPAAWSLGELKSSIPKAIVAPRRAGKFLISY